MVKFIIIRHGFSQFNNQKIFSGQYDVPLAELGYAQAEETGRYVAENFKVDKIYSSDLSRTYNTALPISKAFDLPIITSEKLRERSLGTWNGVPHAEIKAKYPKEYKFFKTDFVNCPGGGGEDFTMMTSRVSSIMEEIAEENDGKTVVVTTHAGFIRALCTYWQKLPVSELLNVPSVSNASVTVVEYENGEASFLLTGYDDHLKELNEKFKLNGFSIN